MCFYLDSDLDLLFKTYRWSAKTTYVIIYTIKSICYNLKHFIMFFTAEQGKSVARLYDIIIHLQTNQRLIEDFWELFPDNKTKTDENWQKANQKKSIPEFITTNWVKVKA
jgi:hypothetical protein